MDHFVPRVILYPGERAHYKVTFHPKVTGHYKHAYIFEIRGLQLDHRILCEALCEIPIIDFTPEKVFQKVLPSKTNRKRPYNEFVYAKDENTFHFGNILISTEYVFLIFKNKWNILYIFFYESEF